MNEGLHTLFGLINTQYNGKVQGALCRSKKEDSKFTQSRMSLAVISKQLQIRKSSDQTVVHKDKLLGGGATSQGLEEDPNCLSRLR